MKRIRIALLTAALLCLCACGNQPDSSDQTTEPANTAQTTDTAGTEQTDSTQDADNTADTENEQETSGTSGDTAAGEINHIVFFETAVADVESTDVDGTAAYSIQAVTDAMLQEAASGEVLLMATDGYSVTATADELSGYYLTLEGDTAPTLLGDGLPPQLSVKNLQYMQYGSEIIYFVQEDVVFGDLMEQFGLNPEATYTFTAADGFAWDALDLEDAQKAEVRGPATTGDVVNVFFYSMAESGAELRQCVDVTLS